MFYDILNILYFFSSCLYMSFIFTLCHFLLFSQYLKAVLFSSLLYKKETMPIKQTNFNLRHVCIYF